MARRPIPVLAIVILCGGAVSTQRVARVSAQPPDDLDRFVQQVLERRDENWKKLREYILSEKEVLDIRGPGQLPIEGFRREYDWYVRDGTLVRSPVRYDGVTLNEDERRQYEDRWLQDEAKRAERRERRRREAGGEKGENTDDPSRAARDRAVLGTFEPRLISEAYFLDFPYEPGNYYLAGHETFEGRDVVKVEYYPTRLLDDEEDEGDEGDRIMRQMHKVVLVTLWIVPDEHQIVKFTFDNVGFGFLPARWLVRLDDLQASMVMGQPFPGVWLPRQISMSGALTLANGTFQLRYTRDYSDYRQADVRSKIRVKDPGLR